MQEKSGVLQCNPKRWMLSRYIDVFSENGNGTMVESFTSGARKCIDKIDMCILEALSGEESETAEEISACLTGIIPDEGTRNDELMRRLNTFAAMGVAHTQLREPPVWLHLERSCSHVPFIDFVEITNQCPARCVMCSVAQGHMLRSRGCMSLQLFERIVNMIGPRPAMKPLILHNSGEPLVHPQLTTMVAIARNAGIQTEISTNPGLLDIDLYRRLCDAGIGRIVVALDGMDIPTLSAIRGPGVLPRHAFRNIDAMLDYRATGRGWQPDLIIQMIKMKLNEHQHRAFIERYGALRLPGVSIFLKSLDAPSGSPLFATGDTRRQFFCDAPWKSLGIFWDGSVVPCCFDLNATLCIGNIATETITEIWNGTRLQKLRSRIMSDRCLTEELCSVCDNRADRYMRPDLTTIQEYPDDWH